MQKDRSSTYHGLLLW